MPEQGWKRLTAGGPWFRGPGQYPIAAYSEFMPPPRLGRKPYDRDEDADPRRPLRPGRSLGLADQRLRRGAWNCSRACCTWPKNLLGVLRHLGRGETAHGIARNKLRDNPYWPESLHERAHRRRNAT